MVGWRRAEVEGLARGRYELSIEVGRCYAAPHVLWTRSIELQDGAPLAVGGLAHVRGLRRTRSVYLPLIALASGQKVATTCVGVGSAFPLNTCSRG